MGFDKDKVNQIKGLMVLGAVLILGIIYFERIFTGIRFVIGIMLPFIVGAAMAFIINILMTFYENKIFKGQKLQKAKRPLSLVLSIVSVIIIIIAVILIVLPRIGETISGITRNMPIFFGNVIDQLEKIFASNPEILKELNSIESTSINWDGIFNGIVEFARSGVGSIVTSTVSLASSVIGGVTNFVIAFVFSIYILLQKEKLGNQADRMMRAYMPCNMYNTSKKVIKLLNRNFRNFITGQCTEAVILGTMFVISMTIFRLPYAIMIGVLIAFTALIPIVGAFIGCVVGAFLILMVSPVKAIIFVILFLTLQQIEGNLIYPKVVGSSVGLPAIWVLVAVTIGGSLMGIVGMLIFIPIISTVYALLREDVNKRNAKKALSENQKDIQKS